MRFEGSIVDYGSQLLENGLDLLGHLFVLKSEDFVTILKQYIFIDELKFGHFAQQLLVFLVHPRLPAYLPPFDRAIILDRRLDLPDFEENFDDIRKIVVAEAVIDDNLYEFLSIGLKIHLLDEVTAQIVAFRDVGTYLYLREEVIVLFNFEHL